MLRNITPLNSLHQTLSIKKHHYFVALKFTMTSIYLYWYIILPNWPTTFSVCRLEECLLEVMWFRRRRFSGCEDVIWQTFFFFFFWDILKEVNSQFTDWLRLDGKSQVSDSMSKKADMTTTKTPPRKTRPKTTWVAKGKEPISPRTPMLS